MRRFISLIASGLLLAAAPAFADAPVSHPYQAQAAGNCQYAGDCTINFPAITTLGDTLIQHVSCVFSDNGGTVTYTQLTSSGPVGIQALPIFAFPTVNGATNYGINTDVTLYVGQGKVASVEVFSLGAAVQNFECTVSGYY